MQLNQEQSQQSSMDELKRLEGALSDQVAWSEQERAMLVCAALTSLRQLRTHFGNVLGRSLEDGEIVAYSLDELLLMKQLGASEREPFVRPRLSPTPEPKLPAIGRPPPLPPPPPRPPPPLRAPAIKTVGGAFASRGKKLKWHFVPTNAMLSTAVPMTCGVDVGSPVAHAPAIGLRDNGGSEAERELAAMLAAQRAAALAAQLLVKPQHVKPQPRPQLAGPVESTGNAPLPPRPPVEQAAGRKPKSPRTEVRRRTQAASDSPGDEDQRKIVTPRPENEGRKMDETPLWARLAPW